MKMKSSFRFVYVEGRNRFRDVEPHKDVRIENGFQFQILEQKFREIELRFRRRVTTPHGGHGSHITTSRKPLHLLPFQTLLHLLDRLPHPSSNQTLPSVVTSFQHSDFLLEIDLGRVVPSVIDLTLLMTVSPARLDCHILLDELVRVT